MVAKTRIFMILVSLILFGCKSTPSTETIADGAKETISNIYDSLPKECQTKQNKLAFDSAVKQVDSVKANCSSQKQILEEKIKQRNLLIVALLGLVLALVFRKVRSILSRII